jgi:hypothetical protein
MLSFLSYVRPKYRIRSAYSYYCVRGPYPRIDGKGRKVAIGHLAQTKHVPKLLMGR